VLNRVAIIDDDASVCRALGRLLRSMDFEAIEYGSAEAFLADQSNAKFCCLLVDIQLTGMSGLDVPPHLAARGDRTPVIFITAHDDPGLRDKAIKKGGARFFRKTDPFQQIIEALCQLGCAPGTPSRGSNTAD
jgi:FixJ family two-component response regulator